MGEGGCECLVAAVSPLTEWADDRMNVLVTTGGYGLIETITGAMSIHSIKKGMTCTYIDESGRTRTKYGTLKDHFLQKFGPEAGSSYITAQMNFIRSLAGYSMATYILALKDRHNSNILIDEEGHLVRMLLDLTPLKVDIDFGFFLSNSPGHGMAFELSPFKLTADYLALIGPHFPLFAQLLKAAFLSIRRHVDEFCILIELLQRDSKLPCFALGDATVTALRARLKLELREKEAEAWVEGLIERSRGSSWTKGYDLYQALVNGIRP
jgi:phosphatidylinositol 4-kinase B